jgi:cyclic-di-GMP-binding protein
LLEHINATFGRTPEFLSKHEQKNLSLALKFHVQTILGSTTERRHDRYQYSAQLDICFSLLSAHFYLSKAKTFNETLMLENNYGFQSESKLLLNWDKDTPDTLPQVNSSRLLDREAKQLYQTSVLDVSLNGYRIKWKGETPKNLRTGEFILVKEETQEKWRGGVIRWIKQSTNKSLELGLEILAQEMYPCAVRMQIDLHTINYHPALLIQKAVFQQQVTLILPGSQTFKEHQTIYLRLGQEEIKICLTKALLITQSFIQFNFELINEQQQGLLDQFMDKQAQELNKQDLWEALK